MPSSHDASALDGIVAMRDRYPPNGSVMLWFAWRHVGCISPGQSVSGADRYDRNDENDGTGTVATIAGGCRRPISARGRSTAQGATVDRPGASVGDVLSSGCPGCCAAWHGCAQLLGPDSSRSVVGTACPGGAGWPGHRPGSRGDHDQAARRVGGISGPFVPAPSLRLAGRARNEANRGPRSAGKCASQLCGRHLCGRPGLPAWAGLARGRHGSGGGAACRVQPQSALENAGGDADDAGRGRRDGSPALLRLAPARRGGIGTALALAIAFIVALPWHIRMVQTHGWEALTGLAFRSWGMAGNDASLLVRLFELAPVTLPLGIYGAARAIRLALIDENNSPETMGGSLWVIWLAVAALAPAFWPGGPRGALDFFLLIPLDLLAAVTVADLVNRRVPVRTLIILAPATAMTVAWWASEDLQGAVDDLMHGRADAATALGLHLVLDLILLSIWFTRRLDQWARRRDDRQRCVLAFFLLTILAITVGTGRSEEHTSEL